MNIQIEGGNFNMDRVKRIWFLSPMRAAMVQASLRIRAVSPEPPLLAHTSSESRGTFRQKARSLPPLNGWACAVKICHNGMLEDTNSLDGAHMKKLWVTVIWAKSGENVSSGIFDQVTFKPAWSAPLLFAYGLRHVFAWPGPFINHKQWSNVLQAILWTINGLSCLRSNLWSPENIVRKCDNLVFNESTDDPIV